MNASSSVGDLVLWDTQSTCLMTSISLYDLGQGGNSVTSLLFVGRSRLLVGTENGLVIDMCFDEAYQLLETWTKHDIRSCKAFAHGIHASAVTNMVVHPDNGTIFACSIGGSFVIFKTHTQTLQSDPNRHLEIVARGVPSAVSSSESDGQEILKLHWMPSVSRYALLVGFETGFLKSGREKRRSIKAMGTTAFSPNSDSEKSGAIISVF
ncbi:hypothetical protein BJ165DRAFT_1411304 [Panaeolus papilionaceus]|nr:hypothetical protein BJ165DRAFT_1411304 [Panaeolus papilionaceus]